MIDCLIGNTDRHNGNWGFIVDANKNVNFAPIYDCGSCLNPMLEDDAIKKLTDVEIKNLAINCYSCIKENNKKINYITYIKQMKNEDCNKSISRVFDKINLNTIKDFINGIEVMSASRKEFYVKIIDLRYNILKEIKEKLN